MPDLYPFDSLETGWATGMVVARLWTMNDGKQLYVPISARAAASLVIAPNAGVPKRLGSRGILLDLSEWKIRSRLHFSLITWVLSDISLRGASLNF